ncbi:MAG TPA: hypothetical protein PL033_18620 [Candidatus Brocadiia bacterium]|nr:hypothetical protein [Candidatus Brocadiia bacterium]
MPTSHSDRRRRIGLIILAAVGAHACIAQAILLRELLVSLAGVEWTIGMALGVWLFGVCVGAFQGERGDGAERADAALRRLCVTVCLLGLAPFLSLIATRYARGMIGPPQGEFPGFDYALAYSLLSVFPTGYLIGAIFPAAARAMEMAHGSGAKNARESDSSGMNKPARLVSLLYAAEGIGSFAGGVVWTLLLVGNCPDLIVAGCSGAMLAGIGLFAWPGAAVARWPAPVAAGLLLAVSVFAPRLESHSVAARWRALTPLEIVGMAQSRHQGLALAGREGAFTLYSNGLVASVFPDEAGNRERAALFLSAHPHPRRVLVLGDAITGLAVEMLRLNIERLDAVEIDDAAIKLVKPHLPEDALNALADNRLHLYRCDARQFVRLRVKGEQAVEPFLYSSSAQGPHSKVSESEPYDLIVVDFGMPANLLSNRVYTREFYINLKYVLNPCGVVVCRNAEVGEYWEGDGWRYALCMRSTLKSAFKKVIASLDMGFYLFASDSAASLATDAGVLATRFAGLGGDGIQGNLVGWHFPVERVAAFEEKAEAAGLRPINSDSVPRACHLYQKLLWARSSSLTDRIMSRISARQRAVRGVFPRVVEAANPRMLFLPVGLILVVLAWLRLKRRREAMRSVCAFWAIGSGGFAAMASQTLLLFMYQSRFGFVFEKVGLLTALFMLGLTVAGLSGAALTRRGRRFGLLVVAEIAMTAAPAGLALLPSAGMGSEWAVATAMSVLGALTGFDYVLCAALYGTGPMEAKKIAGRLNAADNLGALLGAFCAAAAMPVWGVGGVCLAAGILKGGSLLCLAALRSSSWKF